MSWEPVIGLEIHAQLATRSKIFSGASTAFGAQPNAQACIIDLGYPGVLPVLNQEVVNMAVSFGLAIGARIARRSIFARKNYFYPDLPKGYQISQYELPVVEGGSIVIKLDGQEKTVHLTRAHLEEDAGKSVHDIFQGESGIDLNRAGTPLLEIVSEPDMGSPKEASAYMRRVHQLVTWLGICDGNMQEGSLRCDANVSVRPSGQETLGTRAELKNLNSFRFIEKAIAFEIERQIDILEEGGQVVQETRLYDADRDETRPMRSKEEANDYRYFPDPDLLPLVIEDEQVEQIRQTLPELPDDKHRRFGSEFGLADDDLDQLTADRATADYFEALVDGLGGEAKLAANWMLGELAAALNRAGLTIEQSKVDPAAMAGLLRRIADKTISGKIAKDVFEAMWEGAGDADAVIRDRGLEQITDDSAIEAAVDQVIAASPEQVQQFRDGKTKVIGYLVGQVMKATQGKANPQQVNEILRNKLGQ